ncbi:YetF domain-containing protein [Terrilactibacillus laevilacticus]|uniref:YetF domain-containing protein n=1 Tax=Terrilactibacillus laevilacticus TaxID=1380157 RepID=A0ABW5PU69_9BACI|nr:DUF421 domain-containing protein [Terrilactibacillus laevilacticus]
MPTIILRTVFMFIMIAIVIRFSGKKQLKDCSLLDLVMILMIAELAIISITNPLQPLLTMIVPIFIIILLHSVILFVFSKKIVFKETVLIDHGEVNSKELSRRKMTFDDLMTQLQRHNIRNIQDVEFAILEPNGQLLITPNTHQSSNKQQDTMPFPLIINGKVQEDNLKKIHQTPLWLRQELRKLGYRDIKEIAYLVMDDKGTFYMDLNPD